MKGVLMVVAVLTLGAATLAKADQPPPDDKVVAQFCANAKTQMDMNQCAGATAKAADDELNATYQAALKKWAAYPDMIQKLRQSQRAWLAYRDADLKARFAIEDGEGAARGTAYPSEYAFYQASLERERTARLCEYLRGMAYGERDSAPCAELVKHSLVVPNTP